jgi:hypothetical protein
MNIILHANKYIVQKNAWFIDIIQPYFYTKKHIKVYKYTS